MSGRNIKKKLSEKKLTKSRGRTILLINLVERDKRDPYLLKYFNAGAEGAKFFRQEGLKLSGLRIIAGQNSGIDPQ